MPVEENCYGTELDINAVKVARYLYPNAKLEYGDIREYTPYVPADIVFGNPPFHLEWGTRENPISSQMYYCKKAYQILKPAGFLVVIVPQSFLADPFSCGKDIDMLNQWFNLILQFDLPADTFYKSGVEGFGTKVMILQKRSCYVTTRPYRTDKTVCSTSQEIYEKYMEPVLSEKRRNAPKIHFEGKSLSSNFAEDRIFLEKAIKLLFDIKRNKNIRHRAGRCEAFLLKYYTQKQPPDMSWREWQKTKIKKSDVLRYLKKTLSCANRKYEDRIRLVKTNYGFKKKDDREDGEEWMVSSINDCILQQNMIPGYEKLLQRKRREYENQKQPFNEMGMDADIAAYLEKWTVTSALGGEQIRLNPVQKREVNRFLQKRYGAIQFAMGTGKTLCMLAMAQYRLEYSNIRNVFVIGTALAINNTWDEVLQDYHIEYLRVTGRKDMKEIKRGQIVLLTINQLTALKREMRRYVRTQSQKVMLVFDESDTISNPYSKRTKAMLSVFRKCRYKILATGTLTRNHVSEAAPQLELLYNNSINYLSLNPEIYRSKDGTLKKMPNFSYMRPFPAYRRGYQLFSYSHLPKRITVFGIEQDNQDIYNAPYLNGLLDKTVITKSFEEVAGRKIYRIHQVTCPFSEAEQQVYQKALDKFEDMRRNYFAELDNLRKDAMFRILQQLLLLLRICADPSLMLEYTSD
ncbi:DEAD/DEAH box helicase family protein, partial [Mediterraneibacter glycyrrhizinilyticus]|nr:DEAD/DEAH box helicase family protein [Mediterraneibacter glycyrrhizinilyticus]